MNYNKAIQILSRKENKAKGHWSVYVCCDCDCNFTVYETCLSSGWNCPNCESKDNIQIRNDKVGNDNFNKTAQEFIDMRKFDRKHLEEIKCQRKLR